MTEKNPINNKMRKSAFKKKAQICSVISRLEVLTIWKLACKGIVSQTELR